MGNNSAKLQKVPLQNLITLTREKAQNKTDFAKVYQIMILKSLFSNPLVIYSFRNCLGSHFHLLLLLVAWGVFTCSILASIVTILVSIEVILTSIEPIQSRSLRIIRILEGKKALFYFFDSAE